MDTKQRTRSEDAKRRSRPDTRKKEAPSGRTRKETARRDQGTDRRRQQPARRQTAQDQERAARRQQAQQDAERAARHQAAAENTPEEVFKMDGTQERRRREPQDPAAAKRAQQRRRSAQRSQERKKQAANPSKAPKVVYTQPRPFNANHLLLQLTIIIAVVLAITMGLSVFFKVEQVVVYGNNAYSAWAVQEASGIEGGEKLLTFGNIRACGKIKAALPYVDTVRIGIKLPDTVNIYITEFDVVYAIQSQNGTWWLMTSDGRVVEQTDAGNAGSYTKVLGVTLDNPAAGEDAVAYEEPVFAEDATGATDATEPTETIPVVTVTARDRLNAAMSLLRSLELNDLVGEAASIDVTSLSNIELWYGNQYQVRIGQIDDPNHDLDYKIASMKAAIAQLSDYQTGILDVSFTTWEDQPGYTPFE